MRINKKILIIGIVFIMCLLYAKIVFAGRSFLYIDIKEYQEYVWDSEKEEDEILDSILNPKPIIENLSIDEIDDYIVKADLISNKIFDETIKRKMDSAITSAGQKIKQYNFTSIEKGVYEKYNNYTNIKGQLEDSIIKPSPNIDNMTKGLLEEYIGKAKVLLQKVDDDNIKSRIHSQITRAGQKKAENEDPDSFLNIPKSKYENYGSSDDIIKKQLVNSIKEPNPAIRNMTFEEVDDYIVKARILKGQVSAEYTQISNLIEYAIERIKSFTFLDIKESCYSDYNKFSEEGKTALLNSIKVPQPAIEDMTIEELEEYIARADELLEVPDEDIFIAISSKRTLAGQRLEEERNNQAAEEEDEESDFGNGLPSLGEMYRPQVENGNAIDKVVILLNFLTILGVIVIVVAIALMGLGSILGSANEKAEYQHKFAGIVIAAGIMVGGSTIAKLIISVAENI